MAFDLVQAGGYGYGEAAAVKGDFALNSGRINSAAIVNSIVDEGTYTVVTATLVEEVENFATSGATNGSNMVSSEFQEGVEVLLLVTGGDSNADNAGKQIIKQYEGMWAVASLSSVVRGKGTLTLELDKSLPEFAALSQYINQSFTNLRIVVVTVPHFKDITLNQGDVLQPTQGFPLAFKCSGTLTFNGGHIDLRNKGNFTTNTPHYNTEQEAAGILDTDKYSGWENSQTKDRLMMNCEDGTCFIVAKKIVVADSSSRIGNPNTSGAQFYRGATDSRVYDGTKPANVSNIGGSTILLVAGTIDGFVPDIIAKYRSLTTSEISSGKADTNRYTGLARCYIASNTKLRNDEGLYAYDCISDSSRVSSTLNVRSFGDGSDGTSNNYTGQLNNYLAVTARDSSGKVFTYSSKTGTGLALFKVGALVMIHYRHKQTTTVNFSGEFILAHVLGITDTEITVDTKITPHNLSDYNIQLITIPQFSNFTLSTTNSATPKYENGMGGICAIAVNGTCNISGGAINVEGKGGVNAYGRKGLAIIGNAQDCDKLPIGNGHGSVFILAKNLTMNSSTRIGTTYSGAGYGGSVTTTNTSTVLDGGGYSGICRNSLTNTIYSYGGFGGGGGNGTGRGDPGNGIYYEGGYGGNGAYPSGNYGLQGAHIMIVADKITGFNQAAISTGGSGGNKGEETAYDGMPHYGGNGGAGYGGGGGTTDSYGQGPDAIYYRGGCGGYNGAGESGLGVPGEIVTSAVGSGGSSGWAFVYCNQVVNQDTTDTVYM